VERFLIDFEFSTHDGRVYWMPVGIQARDLAAARDIADRLRHGLREKYEVAQWGPFLEGSANYELLLEFRRGRRIGKPEILVVNEYTFRTVPFDPVLTFDEHLELATIDVGEVLPGEQAIVTSMRNRRLPVRLVRDGDIKGVGEILVINVIMPTPGQAAGPRDIPAQSTRLGQVHGRYFTATIFRTPSGTIAAAVAIDAGATQLQLDSDRMNTKIFEKAIELAGAPPAYMTTSRR
jgi:hypothetical protein